MATIDATRREDVLDYAQAPAVVEWLQRVKTLVPLDFSTISDNVAVDITSWNFEMRMEAGIANYVEGNVESVKRLMGTQPNINPPRVVSSSTQGEIFLEIPEDFYLPEIDYSASTKVPCVIVTLVVDTGPLITDAENAIRFLIIIRRGI